MSHPSNLWQLQQRRTDYCALREKPIKSGNVAELAQTLAEDTKASLRRVNMRSIDPKELGRLALELHHGGYLSHDAWEELGEFQVDHPSLIDPLAETQDALKSVRGIDDVKYTMAIQMHETTIDAILGIEELVNYLNGHIVDVYA
jgi:hypothetical protein